MDVILMAWEDFARHIWRGDDPDIASLRNHSERMLRAVVADMATSQTRAEQKAKSEGENRGQPSAMNDAAVGHAIARVNDGFDIGRLVAEFRALRASVERIWVDSIPHPHKEQMDDMRRFNEAIDQLVCASVEAFTTRIDRSRRLFLGILGHDLRQPLGSLRMFTQILASGKRPEESASMLAGMERCCETMGQLLSDVLDFTTSQLGSTIPVHPVDLDLGTVSRDVTVEVQAAFGQQVQLETTGDLHGKWDFARLRQILSNLLSNAVQHGAEGEPITVRIHGEADTVTLAVHNLGQPIPPEAIPTLFDPMVRMSIPGKIRPQGSVGLGLYIARQIALAHGGTIEAESSASGTTFTVRLPKQFDAGKGMTL